MNNKGKESIKTDENWSQARDTSHEKNSMNLDRANLNI